jgi:hypothetical protein
MAGVRREVTATVLVDLAVYRGDEIRGGRSGPLFFVRFPRGLFFRSAHSDPTYRKFL